MPRLALPDPPLTDGVVTLREHLPADRDAVVAALQDPEIPRWTRVPSPYGSSDYDAWLERAREEREAGRSLSLLIVDAGGRVVGGVGLHEVDSGRPDIGYWAAPHARGRGYVTRAVQLMRDHALALGFPRVDLLIHRHNEPSQRVALRAGFHPTEGLTRCPRAEGAGTEFVRYTWPRPASPSPWPG